MMNMQAAIDQDMQNLPKNSNRTKLLADIPVTERRLKLTGISTAVLEGGQGPPVILFYDLADREKFQSFFSALHA